MKLGAVFLLCVLFLLAVLFFLAAAGCSSQVDTYCNRTCAKKAACMPGFDKNACADDCKAVSSTVLPIVRSDYITPLLDCITPADCSAVAACPAKVRMTLSPSMACSSFCTTYIAAANACGIPTFVDQATCVDKWKIYTDDAFKNATPCLTQTCGNLVSCVSNQLLPP